MGGGKESGGCNKEDGDRGGRGGGGMNDGGRGRERNEMHVIPRKHN